MKPFLKYVVEKGEQSEVPPNNTARVLLMNHMIEKTNIRFQMFFADVYCSLQLHELSLAYLYAEQNFVSCLKSPNAIEAFIKKIHQYAAKHLVMIDAYEVSGEYRTKTVTDVDNKTEPMGIPHSLIEKEMRNFCILLHDKLNKIKTAEDAAEAAFYALVEIGRIHPFVNGNGRVSRVVTNCILTHFSDHPAIVIENKQEYYDCFKKCCDGDQKPLLQLFHTLLQKEYDSKEIIASPLQIAYNISGGTTSILFIDDSISFRDNRKINYCYDFEAGLIEIFANSKEFHPTITTFFKRFLMEHWPETIVIQGKQEISTEKGTDAVKTKLSKLTSSFFNESMGLKWKPFPESKVTDKYIGHQVHYFTMPNTQSKLAQTFFRSLIANGFDAEMKQAKEMPSIVVDLTTSNITL